MSAPVTQTSQNGYTIMTQVIPPQATPTGTQQSISPGGPLQKFLKGEPKALGTVQIMIGVLTFLFGIVMSVFSPFVIVYSGIAFWGPLIYIVTGSLAVASSNKLHRCVVNASLVMNVISAIVAGIAIILFSINLIPRYHSCYYSYDRYRCSNDYPQGVTGVLLVFSILQIMISISISAFACKATCSYEPPINVVTMIPNSDRVVMNPLPAHNTHQYMFPVTGATGISPPMTMESPPDYNQIKVQADDQDLGIFG